MAKARPGILKDRNGTWRIKVQVTINGEIINIHKRGFATENSAFLEKEKIINELKTKAHSRNFVTFKSLVSDYFNHSKKIHKPSYIYRSRLLADKYFKKLYNKRLNLALEAKSLKKVVNDINKTDNTIDYKNKLIRLLKAIINYAIKRGLIEVSLVKDYELVLTPFKDNTIKEKKEIVILSREEYSRFLEAIPAHTRDKVLFTLWGQTGLRIGEIRALQPKHFNYINRTITINQQAVTKLGQNQTIITSPKTKKSNRTIHISDNLSHLINEYIMLARIDNDHFMFHGQSPLLPLSENAIRSAQKKYSKLAGVPYLTPHGIRHSNTTWLLKNIQSLDEIGAVSERLGHSSKKVTLDIYFHVTKTPNSNLIKIVDF